MSLNKTKWRYMIPLLSGLAVLVLDGFSIDQDCHPLLISINEQLEQMGVEYRVEMAEYFTTTDGPEFGRTVYASNRGNKQLAVHWVPFDPRRDWSGPGSSISWINDLLEGATSSGLGELQTAAAIGRAMNTWDSVKCSTIPLYPFGDYYFDFGYVQYLLGFGGIEGVAADVTHGGFLPAGFFDELAPGGSNYILGVTFTFLWVDETGTPTDINNDNKFDTAFREIYYNDIFSWAIDANYDVETVALHEMGHGLSQAHFGDIFRDGGKGKLHFAPRAVMNAAYTGVQHKLTGTDNGGHCSIWGNWPNK